MVSAEGFVQPAKAETMRIGTERSAPGSRGRRLLVAFVVIPLVLFLVGLALFLREMQAADRFVIVPGESADGIVALTGGSQRISDAISLLSDGRGRRLLISGVNTRVSREDIARLAPDGERWTQCCVDLGYRARNTIGNAIETRRWLRDNKFRSLIVVTSNYHMPRSLLELGHAAPGVRLIPHAVDGADARTWWREPATIRLVLIEYVKYLAAAVRTRVEGDPERSSAAVMVSGRRPTLAIVGL